MLRSSRLLVSRSMAHLALLLSAASLPTSSGILPFAKSFDSLVAYYVFDDGAGFDLKESVSNVSNAGRVLYESKHQTVNYTQPNWSRVPVDRVLLIDIMCVAACRARSPQQHVERRREPLAVVLGKDSHVPLVIFEGYIARVSDPRRQAVR